MIEKNYKFAVLDDILGTRGRSDLQYVVPQNSLTDFRQRGGLCEPQQVDNFQKVAKPGLKCRHCANIAQHLIHLEYLIRSNYKNELSCNLCNSTLNYLQHANRNIAEIITKNMCDQVSGILSNVSRSKKIRKRHPTVTGYATVKSSPRLQQSPTMKRVKTAKLNISKPKKEDLHCSLEGTTPKNKQYKGINKKKFLSNGIANIQVVPSFSKTISSSLAQKKVTRKKTIKKVKSLKYKYNGKQ